MEIPLSKDKDGYLLKVLVKTGAKITGIGGIEGNTLKLRLAAQPHDGLANKELIEMLSEILNIPKSRIEIIKGKTSKHKIIKLKGELV
ncbi:DUF167 domain-containing protein [Thermodesulfovibrio yellowstonii]|jgi:uncharacterized protein (TIGR00251 family)|uniref:UPF0235 protein THEYE_A0407 n=1 Tax=Thermodesulfovibrio yellowstonii (strain ATCC 51303 / DSM 11347 / YP87) TaxID=289376 RepID=B5YJ39_THEYD|nr:DUF167 domain-containing protein [Thermodesulfovibrio yellowstonii]ACI20543.1 conserved hypothetical protein [Thermodesulfovibrio yellowstonii DSM 11347]